MDNYLTRCNAKLDFMYDSSSLEEIVLETICGEVYTNTIDSTLKIQMYPDTSAVLSLVDYTTIEIYGINEKNTVSKWQDSNLSDAVYLAYALAHGINHHRADVLYEFYELTSSNTAYGQAFYVSDDGTKYTYNWNKIIGTVEADSSYGLDVKRWKNNNTAIVDSGIYDGVRPDKNYVIGDSKTLRTGYPTKVGFKQSEMKVERSII